MIVVVGTAIDVFGSAAKPYMIQPATFTQLMGIDRTGMLAWRGPKERMPLDWDWKRGGPSWARRSV